MVILFCPCILNAVISQLIVVLKKIRIEYDYIVLGLLAFTIRLVFAKLDPFLHDWDERYHALVARNLMDNPFVPMLIKNPVDAYDKYSWAYNHVWLHKQPLFLWQMACSMKLFGVSEFTMRLPSVIMGTLMVLLIYRIAKIISEHRVIAIASGLLVCFANYQLEQIAGRQGMDHNDICFAFYVLASIWAFFELISAEQNKFKWAILIGCCVGCAILTKWLVGLLVFSFWIVCLTVNMRRCNLKEELSYLLTALLVGCAIAIPWQVYILSNFTELAIYEYAYNNRHLYEVVEKHGGAWYYYLELLPTTLGLNKLLLYPAVLMIVYICKREYKNMPLIGSVFYTMLIFIFFSCFAVTKMPGYVYCIYPILLMLLAISYYHLLRFVIKSNFIYIVTICVCSILSLQISKVLKDSELNQLRACRIKNTKIYKNLNEHLPANTSVIFNVPQNEFIDVMFYNNNCSAWSRWVSDSALNKLAGDKTLFTGCSVNGELFNRTLFGSKANYRPSQIYLNTCDN
jgi:4-amino-4-deoxy-L-arabinose transferase-like glycosyltransferase